MKLKSQWLVLSSLLLGGGMVLLNASPAAAVPLPACPANATVGGTDCPEDFCAENGGTCQSTITTSSLKTLDCCDGGKKTVWAYKEKKCVFATIIPERQCPDPTTCNLWVGRIKTNDNCVVLVEPGY